MKDDYIPETWEEETLRLLNEGHLSDALKMFREKHGMVNRYQCKKCKHITTGYTNLGCTNCGCHNFKAVVVIERESQKGEM